MLFKVEFAKLKEIYLKFFSFEHDMYKHGRISCLLSDDAK